MCAETQQWKHADPSLWHRTPACRSSGTALHLHYSQCEYMVLDVIIMLFFFLIEAHYWESVYSFAQAWSISATSSSDLWFNCSTINGVYNCNPGDTGGRKCLHALSSSSLKYCLEMDMHQDFRPGVAKKRLKVAFAEYVFVFRSKMTLLSSS